MKYLLIISVLIFTGWKFLNTYHIDQSNDSQAKNELIQNQLKANNENIDFQDIGPNNGSSKKNKKANLSKELIEKKMTDIYSLTQEEMAQNLGLLNYYQNELELSLALNDKKIESTLLLPPTLRIAASIYLEISPIDLTQQFLHDAEINKVIWKKIVLFSQSNDFKVLLNQGKLSKEEVLKSLH